MDYADAKVVDNFEIQLIFSTPGWPTLVSVQAKTIMNVFLFEPK
jgi:hypothetical protein